MIKFILFFNLLIFTFQNLAQTSNVDSLRWVLIDSYFQRTPLEMDKGINDSTLYGSMKKAINQQNKVYYLESKNPATREMMYATLWPRNKLDSIELDSTSLILSELQDIDSNDILIIFNEDEALEDWYSGGFFPVDCYGNVFSYAASGSICCVFLPKSISVIKNNYSNYFCVKEELFYDSITHKNSYRPIAIKVSSQQGSTFKGEFWFDLKKYASINPEVESMNWYQYLMRREYKGVQYGCLKKKVGIKME